MKFACIAFPRVCRPFTRKEMTLTMNENSVASTHKPIDYRVVQVWPTEERQFYLYEQGALGRSRREQVA